MTTTAQIASSVLAQIKERGYWRVVIHPDEFVQDRVPFSELFDLVDRNSVALRGWNFPHVEIGLGTRTGLDWIEQGLAWHHLLEYWRMYQSGQFVDYAAMGEDWYDRSNLAPADPSWRPGQSLGLSQTVYRFTEIFEFAARLAGTDAYDTVRALHIEIYLHGLENRQLVNDNPRRVLHRRPVSSINVFPYSADINRAELLANARQLAVRAAEELFMRFQWKPVPGLLTEIQEELRLR